MKTGGVFDFFMSPGQKSGQLSSEEYVVIFNKKQHITIKIVYLFIYKI